MKSITEYQKELESHNNRFYSTISFNFIGGKILVHTKEYIGYFTTTYSLNETDESVNIEILSGKFTKEKTCGFITMEGLSPSETTLTIPVEQFIDMLEKGKLFLESC